MRNDLFAPSCRAFVCLFDRTLGDTIALQSTSHSDFSRENVVKTTAPSSRPSSPPTAGTSPQLCCGGVGGAAGETHDASCCCLSGGCPPGVPACFCPADRPFAYGNVDDGGEYCCKSKSGGFPDHCSGGGECCLRPGLKKGCQGIGIC